tara:strand:- start:3863 stop:4246 length:384 start_codon:yes stop_codon:yes gene_type:complete
MRVNVTYSVDLSEVRGLIEELLLKTEENIENLNKKFPDVQKLLQKEDEKKASEAIEECRKNLSAAAFSLYDCQNILNGYQQARLQAQQGILTEHQPPQGDLGSDEAAQRAWEEFIKMHQEGQTNEGG